MGDRLELDKQDLEGLIVLLEMRECSVVECSNSHWVGKHPFFDQVRITSLKTGPKFGQNSD
jgi:hypothetical protein